MATYDVDVEITYRATVQVDAHDKDQAKDMAEKGPAAWYGEPMHKDYAHTWAASATRQSSEKKSA